MKKILLAIDVSGSMTGNFKQNLFKILMLLKCSKNEINIIIHDFEILHLFTFYNSNIIKIWNHINNNIKLSRGGTSHKYVLDFAKNNSYDNIYLMTDGYSDIEKYHNGLKINICIPFDRNCNMLMSNEKNITIIKLYSVINYITTFIKSLFK